MPSGTFVEKTFKLEHADPEQIKKNIDDLYGETTSTDSYSRYRSYDRRYGQRSPSDIVKAISFPTMQQVTVIASPENMRKIEAQVKEWDVQLDISRVKPLIITLQNTDPVKMAELLKKLFSEEAAGGFSFWDYIFGGQSQKKNIVGPLYGQLTFEEVPGTKKLIVISKMPEAYKVIEEFVRDLDRHEMAEIPRVVTVKYADVEDLSIRLNAMFNEPGTNAPFWLSERGLSPYSMTGSDSSGSSPSSSSSSSPSTSSSGNTSTSSKTPYNPPWGSGARQRTDEMPISNVIGRIRFVPDPHSKSIMVLCPPEFMNRIVEMIQNLDVPGKQVRVKAVILEIDHRNMTSLGVQLTSNEGGFGLLNENAITALNNLTFLEEHGSMTFELETQATALVDFLVKKVNAKVLNQQTLWTKDNEESDFFKGQIVGFYSSLSISDTGGRATSGIDYQSVGMVLRVRPSITPEKNVDMTINLIASQLTGEKVNDIPVRRQMNTQTKMIIKDGETIMLGGMLDQEDSTIERKVPLIGDIPFIGGLFRHTQKSLGNMELLVFVTPYVIDETGTEMLPETRKSLEKEKEKLDSTIDELQSSIDSSE
jgi:general secretion pathway protein D